MLELAPGAARLSRLKERLPGISTGVLEQRVQRMSALGLLHRRRFREVPPRVEVELTDSGRELVPIASALARWGMRHQWSRSYGHDHERLRADALMRQLPALLEATTGLPDGIIKTVLAGDADRICNSFHIACGNIAPIDDPRDKPTACVEGDEAAWIAALGPERDPTGLTFTGEQQLGRRLLHALPTPVDAVVTPSARSAAADGKGDPDKATVFLAKGTNGR